MLVILLVHCFYDECSCFEINSVTEKFDSVLPTLLSSLSFYHKQPLMRTSQLWDVEAFVNRIISCSVDLQLILELIKLQDKFLNLVLLSMTLFIQFCIYELPSEQLFTSAQNSQNTENSYSEKLKPNSPVTSTNVGISPKYFLSSSFNPFATLV